MQHTYICAENIFMEIQEALTPSTRSNPDKSIIPHVRAYPYPRSQHKIPLTRAPKPRLTDARARLPILDSMASVVSELRYGSA